MDEQRKCAILFAATILAVIARKRRMQAGGTVSHLPRGADLRVASVGPVHGPGNGMLSEVQTDAVPIVRPFLAMYDRAAPGDLVFDGGHIR